MYLHVIVVLSWLVVIQCVWLTGLVDLSSFVNMYKCVHVEFMLAVWWCGFSSILYTHHVDLPNCPRNFKRIAVIQSIERCKHVDFLVSFCVRMQGKIYALALCRTFRVRLSGVVLGSDCNEVPRITVVDTLWSGCSLLREWGGDSPPPPAHQIFTSQGKGWCSSFSCSYIRVLWNYDFIKMLPTDNAAGLDEVCRRISPPCFLAECHKRWVVFSLSILCIFNCLFSSVNQRECHCIAQLCWCDVKNLLTYLTPCGLQQSRPYPVAVAIFNNLQSVCDGVSVWLYSLC